MRRIVLFTVMLAVLAMNTAGLAAAHEHELLETEHHALALDDGDQQSAVHGTNHSCHIGAHLVGLHYDSKPPVDTSPSSLIVPAPATSAPLVFLELPLRPPRTAA